MHVHVSALEFVIFALYLIIFGAAWRWVAAKNSENSIGQAMAFIY